MKLTLATSILVAINELHTQSKSFSAYDITKSLRVKCNTGLLVITDLPPPTATYSGQSISHETVRQQVHELFAENLIPDFTADDGTLNGRGYVLYEFNPGNHDTSDIAKTAMTIPTVTTTKPQSLFTGNPITNSVTAKVAVTSFNQPVTNQSAITAADLKAYIDLQHSRRNTVTLKKIQSRFKRYPTTCAEIAKLVRSAGYNVRTNIPDAPSLDTVESNKAKANANAYVINSYYNRPY